MLLSEKTRFTALWLLSTISTVIEDRTLACPFFFPTERAHDIALPHPARLPLGAAWRGVCQARSEQSAPNSQELQACNLGYAHSCARLPEKRVCDAVRFGVVTESIGRVAIQFVLESQHLPVAHGRLEYDRLGQMSASVHPEPRVQHMAECFLRSYLERRNSVSG